MSPRLRLAICHLCQEYVPVSQTSYSRKLRLRFCLDGVGCNERVRLRLGIPKFAVDEWRQRERALARR